MITSCREASFYSQFNMFSLRGLKLKIITWNAFEREIPGPQPRPTELIPSDPPQASVGTRAG